MLRAAAAAGISETAFWDMLPREFERRMRAWREERERRRQREEARSEELVHLAALVANHALSDEPIDPEALIASAREDGEDDQAPRPTPEEWGRLDLSNAH